MHDLKLRRFPEQLKIPCVQFVQVRDDPALIECSGSTEQRKRRLLPAIVHGSSDTLQEIKRGTVSIAKHLHLLARLGEMSREQNVLLLRDLFATRVEPRRGSEGSMRREAPLFF